MNGTGRLAAASAILIAAAAFALWWSGFIPALGRDRGLLQVTVAVPLTCAVAGFVAGRWSDLGRRALTWGVLPLVAMVAVLGGAFAGDYWALPASAALAGVAAVPWLVGVWAGAPRGRGGAEGRGGP